MVIDLPELHFPDGLIGFPEGHRYTLVRWGGPDSPYSLLRSLDANDLEFLVVPTAAFFPEYELEIDDGTAGRLGLDTADDALVLLVITLSDPVEASTANLLGPVVINTRTRKGMQVVVTDERYSTREPLFDLVAA